MFVRSGESREKVERGLQRYIFLKGHLSGSLAKSWKHTHTHTHLEPHLAKQKTQELEETRNRCKLIRKCQVRSETS